MDGVSKNIIKNVLGGPVGLIIVAWVLKDFL